MTVHSVTYELTFRTSAVQIQRLYILREFLVNNGIKKEEIIEIKDNHSQCFCLYFLKRREAIAFTGTLKKIYLKGIRFDLKSLRQRDWRDQWKRDFKPFALTKFLTVVPAWQKNRYSVKPGQRVIYIDTTLAFGSGLHETTRFMSKLIESCAGKFQDFLDIGTGTGILTIVAAFCGARTTQSLDINDDAVATARANLKRNGFRHVPVRMGDIKNYKPIKKFDFVAANLVTQDLIKFGKKIVICVKPNKYLAVSGISLENLRQLQKSFKAYPLRCLRIFKGRQWAAILYQKLLG